MLSSALRTLVAIKSAAAAAAASRWPQRLIRSVSTASFRHYSNRLWLPTSYQIAGGRKRGLVVAATSNPHSELTSSLIGIQEGRKLRVSWADGRESSYHAVWLRHNCQCPNCTSSSNQRLPRRKNLEGDIRITSSSVAG